jgi:DNA-binding NarL/FixJ family response regulator
MSHSIKIKIAVVDDHLIVRQGLINLLNINPKFEIVGDYDNGLDLMNKIDSIKPDIILLDIEMPIMNGKETIINLKKKYNHIEVIMLSSHYSNIYVQEFFDMGARGFLSKGTDINVLNEAIIEVYNKGVYFSSSIPITSISQLVNTKKLKPTVNTFQLNPSEIEILRLLCLEYSSKEIASKLNFSVRTIETYRQKLMEKTQSKNVIGLIIYAFFNQILNIKDFPKSSY